ncbi:MAG: hypothetical protein ABIJ47_05605 [Candidatus Bathyarchaeota archaeon]
MAKIVFEVPNVCDRCGFHNFNIVGSIYNGGFNYTHLAVQCMRCGHKQVEIRLRHSIMETL